MPNWNSTRYNGVRYREHPTEKHRGRPKKYFVVRYKRHGRLVEEAIGWESSGTNAQVCADIRGQILTNIKTGEGYQSLQEKRGLETAKRTAAKSEAITLSMAFRDFLKTRDLKDRTIRDYKRSMGVAFPDWSNRRVIDIKRDSIAKRHEKLGKDQGAAQANQHMRFLRSLLNFAAGYYEDANGDPLIEYNPVQRLSQTKAWYRVPRRQTIIKPHDLPIWFQSVTGLENKLVKDYLLFLLLTGSRRGEGMTLEVEQVDLKQKSYTFLDPKNRQPLTLPLPSYLYKIIKDRIMNLPKETKYVFPGHGPKGHLVEPKHQVKKVADSSGVKFTLHDLRRHFITVADSLDLGVFSIKRLVNHSIGSDVTSGYVVSDVERLRKPMQQIEDRILRLANVKEKGKVIRLGERR